MYTSKDFINSPDLVSQILTVLSYDPLANVYPSYENAKLKTKSLCP